MTGTVFNKTYVTETAIAKAEPRKSEFNLNVDYTNNAYLIFDGKVYDLKKIINFIINLSEIEPCQK